jgi:hypothetical protein
MDDAVKTSEDLFLASFEGGYEDEAPWDAVRALRHRNTAEVFKLASAYCRSGKPIRRARALDVLAQLGAGPPPSDRPYLNASVSIALAHLREEDPLVVHSAAWALAHLRDERAVGALIERRNDPDPDVRLAVAYGMAGPERPEATQTLIELMEDEDEEVRNCATFGLGTTYGEDGSG